MRDKRAVWLTMYCLLAAFIFAATQTEYPYQPLTEFLERPWIFLSSFLCQPAESEHDNRGFSDQANRGTEVV